MKQRCICGASDCPFCYPGRKHITFHAYLSEGSESDERFVPRISTPVFQVKLAEFRSTTSRKTAQHQNPSRKGESIS